MKKMILLLVVALTTTNIFAQIPEKVTEIMKKCEEVMENPKGLETDMKLHVGMMVISVNGTMKLYSKGDLERSSVKIKVLGMEMIKESGFDGEYEWEFKKAREKSKKKGTEKDSLIISKPDKKKKGEYSVDLGMDKDYNKATLKEKDNLYIITFSDLKNPKDEDLPKKAIIKINKNNYYLHEFEAKAKGATMRLTATKYKIGVSDDVFKLDTSKYPDAVIVRK